jgi:hypothetical protein
MFVYTVIYALLPLVVSGVLVIRYLRMSDPSPASKIVIVLALVASLIVWWKYPGMLVVAVLLEVGISLFILIYLRVNPYAS